MVVSLVLPMAVSVGVPLAFLYAVRRLDLYASGGVHVVVACFLAGLAAFAGSYGLNTFALRWFSLGVVVTLVAPVVEEVLKSAGLVFYVGRPDFTYFVDGAIYGFAAGTAFAVVENLFYLSQAPAGLSLGLSVNRAFSTSLMHGSASALVGVALGRLRFGRGRARLMALLAGWTAAMALHLAFNALSARPLAETLVWLVGLGFGGVGLVSLFILWGLREERAWLRESLGLEVGVSAAESAVVQRLADLEALLAPVEGHFGAAKRRQVEDFLRLQARLGLKRKAQQLTADPVVAGQLAAQVAALQAEVDALRRAVGVYCMAYVRSILPREVASLWDQLEVALARERVPGLDLWRAIGERTETGPG